MICTQPFPMDGTFSLGPEWVVGPCTSALFAPHGWIWLHVILRGKNNWNIHIDKVHYTLMLENVQISLTIYFACSHPSKADWSDLKPSNTSTIYSEKPYYLGSVCKVKRSQPSRSYKTLKICTKNFTFVDFPPSFRGGLFIKPAAITTYSFVFTGESNKICPILFWVQTLHSAALIAHSQ